MTSNNQNGTRYQSCNGPTIRALRQARGWTQAELAQIAGYSVRLVQKAEAGGSVAAATLGVLAKTLSSDNGPVEIEDLLMTPLMVVQEFLELVETHQDNTGPVARHLLANEVVFWCAGDPKVIPFAGEWHGPEGVTEYYRLFFSVLTASADGFLRNVQYLANGKEVVCWMEAFARVAGMPSSPSVWVWHHYQIEDGKIARHENHFDTLMGSQHLAEAQARGLLGTSQETL